MKFRRRSETSDSAPGSTQDGLEESATPDPADVLAGGPFDADELSEEAASVERVDLGSLWVAPFPGRELRLQVDESTGAVQAALLTADDGALELRAFAAPRHGDLWSDVRPQLAEDIARRGGASAEREGRWGTELVCQLEVQLPDGQTGTQVSRIIGINGPRWMLRATLLGRPAVDGDYAGPWEDGLTGVVVRRGTDAMPVGEALPLTLPPQAERVS